MPKRAHEETKEERWERKKKKYENKLETKRQKTSKEKNYRRVIYSSDEHSTPEEVERQQKGEGSESDAGSKNPDDTNNNDAVAGASGPDDDGVAVACSGLSGDCEVLIDDFDPDLIQALGEAETDVVEYGDDLQNDIASHFQKILLNGLKKETKEELWKKYLFPKNVPLSKGPTLNPDIGAMLVETCKQRDKRLLAKQDQLGRALSALGKAMTSLLKKKTDIPEVIRILNDAGKLLADSHYTETDTRRSIILPLIDKSLSEPFKDRKRDTFLFGEKLGELVKNSRGIKKTGQLIQAHTSSTGLNYKGPWSSSQQRPQRGGGQPYTHRASWPRATMTSSLSYRRRAPPPLLLPPAPPARRRQQLPAHNPAAARRQPAHAQRPPANRS